LATLLLPPAAALAQRTASFTVLTTNADLKNSKLYAEIMYEKPSCSDYQARFKLVDKSGLELPVAVDSVLNNAGTYALSVDRMSLMRPQAGGYKLRFSLPKGVKASDSVYLCIESHKLAYRCRGCGTGGSDAIFEPNSISKNCPYQDNDMLACHKRKGAAGNWEGWIQDPRDCKPYRVALMPDGRWWFAQNLAYTETMENSGNANIGLNNNPSGNNSNLWGNYWCVGIPPRGTNNVTATSGQQACNTYGAIYTWYTAMRRNGISPATDKPQPRDWFSQVQGICPDGWLLPSDFDWGTLLNTTEGCLGQDAYQIDGAAPCNHLLSSATGNNLGRKSFQRIKSTLSCPPHLNVADTSCATVENAAWIWHRFDANSKLITPRNLGEDVFGFSLLPAGRRFANGSSSYFTGTGMYASFWSSSEYNSDNAYYRYWDGKSDLSGSFFAYGGKFHGKNVRCLKDSQGDSDPSILRLRDVSGENTNNVTFTAYTTFGTTVDWYDAPENGNLLLAGSKTYTTNVPIRVYARARNINSGKQSSTVSTACATFTYRYSGTYYSISLVPGVYDLTCYGAKGGDGTAAGGNGGMVNGMYATSTKVAAYVFVGGMGKPFNGAGLGGPTSSGSRPGGQAGATGGGASDVRVKITGHAGRIIVAGGGGGGGGRGSDYHEAGKGGEQNTNGKNGIGFVNTDVAGYSWPHGGGGGGGGGYRNGGGGNGGAKFGKSGCRSGNGGAAGAANMGIGNGLSGGEPSYYGCPGGGGGGGTHYIGGVRNGIVKNDANPGDGYVVIKPQ
jgi:uncharacterized protein (TIGR02145 family)